MNLPAAFAYETTMDDTYVKIPYKRVKLVGKYLALLEEGDEARGNSA